jgi:NDP-4-keto-2,6-dideoxyhexose 3-C-methyltransferase
MKPLLELGDFYVSDFVKEQPKDRKKYSLNLYRDSRVNAPRLHNTAPPETMWGQYWYRSGINASMTKELRRIVEEITDRVKLKEGDAWLDIACNDGTLLSFVPNKCEKFGIDPADDSYLAESSKHGKIAQTYFTREAFRGLTAKKAKVITCIAMFYDLDDPEPFVQDLYNSLDDNGTLVLQMSYTPLMIEQMAFDNICHEHVYYYDLYSIWQLFCDRPDSRFKVMDVRLNDTNGGSFRIYLQKEEALDSSFGTQPLRDVCHMRIRNVLATEDKLRIDDFNVWQDFGRRLQDLKEDVRTFITDERAKGKTVWGYGASTKGNTLLQYFELDNTMIDAIAERSPYKFGLRTIGTDIPIVSEDEMRAAKPDYLLVLPWHFIDEFQEREVEYLKNGGAFIVPCPNFKVIRYEDCIL